MSNQLPTARTPSRAGSSPKHGKPSNEASESITPASGVNPKAQRPRAICRPASQLVRVPAQPVKRSELANDHGNSANTHTRREGPERLRQHPRGPEPPGGDESPTP
jgi:hypothetical protein